MSPASGISWRSSACHAPESLEGDKHPCRTQTARETSPRSACHRDHQPAALDQLDALRSHGAIHSSERVAFSMPATKTRRPGGFDRSIPRGTPPAGLSGRPSRPSISSGTSPTPSTRERSPRRGRRPTPHLGHHRQRREPPLRGSAETPAWPGRSHRQSHPSTVRPVRKSPRLHPLRSAALASLFTHRCPAWDTR